MTAVHPNPEGSGLSQWLQGVRRIGLLSHLNPDGDAVGSLIGLTTALEMAHFECIAVVPNAYPDSFRRLPGIEKIRVFDRESERVLAELGTCDRLLTLDFNRLDRAGERLGEWLEQSAISKGMIDHHEQPADYAAWRCWETASPSTCELVWACLKTEGWQEALPAYAAQWLYVGMVTDTGSFRFPSVRPQTHRAAAEMLERGARPEIVHQALFEGDSPRRLRLFGAAYRTFEVWENHRTVVFRLEESELVEHGYEKGDTEGLVNMGLTIDGMELSAFFVIREGKGKVSLRSKGDRDVNALAAALYGGGGHRNAAGGHFDGSIDAAVAALKGHLDQSFAP
ncbi:hypothetical protein GC167_04625 [bacterium]|nr:hypothetical protein [bacterium]